MDNNNLDMTENLNSSWDDFFGPSSDLVPTLMSIFDTMIGKSARESTQHDSDANRNSAEQVQGHPRSPALGVGNLNNRYATERQQHFPVLRIVEPGDVLDEALTASAGSKVNAARRCASFRTAADHKVSDPCKKRLLCDDRPKSTSSTATSMTSSSSACSSASASSLMSSTAGGSQLTCLASVESLADSALGRGGGSEVSSSDLSQATNEEITSQTWRGQPRSNNNNDLFTHSADSGDSGVSSPGPSSDASSSSQKNEAADADLSYMDRVVMEVVESELVYVKDLEQVVQGYLYHWRHEGNAAPLSQEQSDLLFGNVEDIHRFSAEFLEQLQMCGRDPVEVARCFVRNNTGFTIYTNYCTNYPRSVSVLTELMRNESAGRAFRDRQTQLGHPLPLGSYLLKPVQRILKYHLLLQNIVKHYERTAPGYSDIIVALSAMTGIAHHINDMKRKHEHAVRVQEVQSLLYGWPGEDLTTYGELVAEGSFRMYGAKAPRHVFLLDKMLLVCKKKEDGALGYKTHILCSNLMLIESVPGEPLSFHVIPFDNPRLQYTLEARNLEQKREWTLQLKRVILENYDAVIPLHARQLVLQLGQERCERQTTLERSATKRQHSAPEYLERRKNSSTGIKNRVRKSRKNDTTSPRESPLLPRRFRRSLDHSRDRSVSRDRVSSTEESTPTRKQSTESCPASLEKRHDFDWSNCDVTSSQADLGSFSIPEEETSVTEAVEIAHLESKPESLEHIVEQLVLQNVEIKRILERKKRRDARLKSQLKDPVPSSEIHSPERTEETRFPRCPTRRSLDSHPNKIETPAKQKTECENRSPAVNRSLSCPARQAVRITKKSETSPSANVGNKLHKVINQLGSPEQWPSWIRSLSPTQKRAENRDQNKESGNEDQNPSPCVPSVWLRMQSEHLAEPAKKSGSLPRSFQVHQEGKARWSDRPITIASDCPTSIGLKSNSVEFYLNCEPGSQPSVFSSSTLDNNSLTDFTATPRVSAENIHFHPDHKIYRRSNSRASLRSVLTTVSAKLSHFKSGSEFWGSLFNVTNDQSRQANNNKLLHYLSRQYTSLLKQRTRFSSRSGIGSATVAARMAKENDYALPKFCSSKSDLTKSSTSLVSKTTFWESLEAEAFAYFDSDSQSESDREETLSIDSFYEHSFEAIEEFLDSDWCYRDSVLFTEREDLNTAGSPKPQEDVPRQKLPPPPVPRKPARTLAVLERLRTLEDQKQFCKELNNASSSLENLKSIDQRRKELDRQNAVTMVTKNGDESETSSQHSTSTVNTVVELHPTVLEEPSAVEAPPTVPKGWVKYVIGKLQGDGK